MKNTKNVSYINCRQFIIPTPQAMASPKIWSNANWTLPGTAVHQTRHQRAVFSAATSGNVIILPCFWGIEPCSSVHQQGTTPANKDPAVPPNNFLYRNFTKFTRNPILNITLHPIYAKVINTANSAGQSHYPISVGRTHSYNLPSVWIPTSTILQVEYWQRHLDGTWKPRPSFS